MINEESNAGIIPEAPATFENYYKLELYKNKTLLSEAKKKATLIQNTKDNNKIRTRSNNLNNNYDNNQDEFDINISDLELTDINEVEMIQLQCKITATKEFNLMQESIEKAKSKKNKKISSAIKVFDTHLGASALSVIQPLLDSNKPSIKSAWIVLNDEYMKGMDISSVYIIEYLANYKYNPTQSLRNFRSEITDIFEIYDTAERINHGEFSSFDDDIDAIDDTKSESDSKRDNSISINKFYYITESMQLYYITKAIRAGTDKYNNDLNHATRMKLSLRDTMNLLYETESRISMKKLSQPQQYQKHSRTDDNNNKKHINPNNTKK